MDCAPYDVTVLGTSMEPLLPINSVVTAKALPCAGTTDRGDIVLFRHAGSAVPYIKHVIAVPGDRFALTTAVTGNPDASRPLWHLTVNDQRAATSTGQPYLLDARAWRMLHLYEVDYHGVIPPDSYLVLGDAPQGSRDSTRFGLIEGGAILAKVARSSIKPPAISTNSR